MSKIDSTNLDEVWAAFAALIEANQPAGEIVIPSGKDTGLYVHVKPTKIPAVVGLRLGEEGIRKPLTDISKDAKQGDESWNEPHKRRLAKRDNWYNGDYAVRGGGVADPVGVQMKEDFTAQLKKAGLSPKTHPDIFKGRVGDMIDAYLAAGGKVKDGKEAKLKSLRDAAVATLASRGKAAAALDLTTIEL